ncbi:MAG TPA: CBS domain-containing protein [Gaiellaceae bacterium]|nr:CBS domain-containing protein [Gaiellaceae bacterium]
MKISELMQRDVVTVAPETTLKQAAALLVRHRISGLPVVRGDGTVAGVLSEADVLERHGARTAGEAMSAPAIAARPTQSAAEAAALLSARRIKRLPVVEDGRLVGIVTRADLVRAFQRSDAEIEREIVEQVLLHDLWISPDAVGVVVEEGTVRLRGSVDSASLAETVVAFTRRVPGVVAVESALVAP